MCGLVGIFHTDERPIDRALLRRMNDSLAHRGPDGWGDHVAAGIGLAHRRLAIIDVEGGRQPLFNEDGSVVVVFNGEIYNFQPLADQLEQAGHIFSTRSDTEVIVHAWEEWGEACVEHFRGMFAFALWDQRRQTLFLARDRLGKKPLHYAVLAGGGVVFGSEIKAVLAHPEVGRAMDPLAVEDYFAYGYVPDPRTIYAAIRKLPPAHTLVWRRGDAPKVTPYWDLPFDGVPITDMAEAQAELLSRVREATRLRMISDVPLGAFLSGGVDSSAVVALMAGLSSQPVRSFSIAFTDSDYDESAYARQIAERYHTDHHVSEANPDDLTLLDRLAAIYDEPFGDSSAVPTFLVCALTRQRVKVALSGDGGDELFGGYRRYRLHVASEKVRAPLPTALRAPLFGLLGRLYPRADWAPRPLRAKNTFQELALDSAGAYFRAVSVMPDEMRAGLFSASFRRALQGYGAAEVLRGHMAAAQTDDPLLAIQYADLKTWLPGGILVKVDRASMANSLEVRAPLLDHELAEWSARLAQPLKLKGGNGKNVLKRAMEPLVPSELLYRRKQGFSMPLARWFRGPLRSRIQAMATGGRLAEIGIFNSAALARLVDQHVSGQCDHSAPLWLLLMFEAFLHHADGECFTESFS